MSGLTKRNFIVTVVVLAVLTALSLTWSFLPHLLFAVLALLVACFVGVVISRRSTAVAAPAPPLAASPVSARPGPAGPVSAAPVSAAPVSAGRGPALPVPARTSASRSAANDGQRRRPGRRSGRPVAALPPDAIVDLTAERQAAGVDAVLTELDRKLVGLVPVKTQVEQIASLLLIDRARRRFGLDAPRPNLHMCFTGDPGTGKTTVALQMAELLHRLGYLETGNLVHAMRDDLVGEYIGQTAPKTKRVLERAMGGVLFIDEAYYLYRATDSKDYGQESIDILLQVMENDRDRLVVILAGYKDRMDGFFDSNPGMSSRIAHHLDFAPYTLDELVAIGQMMLADASYYLSGPAELTLREQLGLRMHEPRFANARSVRNDLERARLRHAYRLATDPQPGRSRDDLMRLEPADVLLTGAAG